MRSSHSSCVNMPFSSSTSTRLESIDDNVCYATVQAILHCTDQNGRAAYVEGFDSKRPADILRAMNQARS
jgi:hypothetical protein